MKPCTAFSQRWNRWIALPLAAVALATTAWAQSPASSKPITIVVGFAPGAGTDFLARSIAESLQQRLKQTVIVENKPGAGGTFAVNAVARSPADGRTLLFAPNTLVIAPHVQPAAAGAPIHVLTDLQPISQVTRSTLVLVTNPSALPIKDGAGLTALARNKPGLTYATAGNGTPQHIAGELYARSADIKITHVPYRGTSPALIDLLGGHVSMAISSLGAATPYLESGRLMPVAVVEKTRSPLLPDVPTLTEQGIDGVELSGWFGLLAPRGTPAEQVEKLNRLVNEIIATPDIQKKFSAQGEFTAGGSVQDFARLLNSEYNFYEKIVKEYGIKSE